MLKNIHIPTLPEAIFKQAAVGIGEVVHGSGGLHQVAGALIEQLIVRGGSRVILFEAPLAAVEKINALTQVGQVVPAQALADLYFVWRSKENLAFFNRLSELNKHLSVPVQLIGIDVRQPASEIAALDKYSEARGLPLLRNLFPFQDGSIAALRDFERGIHQEKVSIETTAGQAILDHLRNLKEQLNSDRKLSPSERGLLQLFTRKLECWTQTYMALSHNGPIHVGLSLRDEGISDVAKYYLDNQTASPAGPIIVWAHLGHLAFDVSTLHSSTSLFKSGKLLGSQIRSKLNEHYSVIAVMARVTGASGPDGSTTVFTANPDSLEHKGLHSDMPTLLQAQDLAKLGEVRIGETDNQSSPLKESYPDIRASSLSQFDYAVIVPLANAMKVCDSDTSNK